MRRATGPLPTHRRHQHVRRPLDKVDRLGGLGGRWSRAIPLGSAVLVTLLGLGITLGGLASLG